MATHSTILAWEIPWTEGPGGLQSMGSQRVRHDWATEHSLTSTEGPYFAGTLVWEGDASPCNSELLLSIEPCTCFMYWENEVVFKNQSRIMKLYAAANPDQACELGASERGEGTACPFTPVVGHPVTLKVWSDSFLGTSPSSLSMPLALLIEWADGREQERGRFSLLSFCVLFRGCCSFYNTGLAAFSMAGLKAPPSWVTCEVLVG